MATSDTPIPFTVGDQERLKGIETTLRKIELVVCELPCKTDSPCPANDRIESLEDSRKRGRFAAVTLSVGLLLYFFKLLVEHIAVGG